MDQTMEAAYSFGLDLGTHRSLMAVKAKGGTVEAIIPSNQECRKGIPSLFWRTAESDGGRELLCEQVALEQGEVNDPEGVVRSVKTRLLEQAIVLHGRSYTPQEIAAKEVGHVYALSLSEAEERGIFETPRALTVGVPGALRRGGAHRHPLRAQQGFAGHAHPAAAGAHGRGHLLCRLRPAEDPLHPGLRHGRRHL